MVSEKTKTYGKMAVDFLVHPRMAFYLLPALMVLLVIGTLAQKYMGVFAAQTKYFASFYFWEFGFPLPGGYTLFGLFFLSLFAKFVAKSEWSLGKSGIILSHFGVLLLLLGGFMTALTGREGFIAIAEGDTSAFVYDYHIRELLVGMENGDQYVIPFDDMAKGDIYGVPFDVMVLETCQNCKIVANETGSHDQFGRPFIGMARHMALEKDTPHKELERNMSGVTFLVQNTGIPGQDGVHVAFEGMPRPIHVQHKGELFTLIFGKQQRFIPFSLELKDFQRDVYPGTNDAMAYASEVVVHDQGSGWPVRISMNAPLRYRGYTFYQSSFEQSPDTTVSVLSVVENEGRLLPYIGTFVICLGLFVHLFIILSRGRRRR